MASRCELRRRRHEFRPYRGLDGLGEDPIDREDRGLVDFPSHDLADRRQLVRPPRAPQSNSRVGAIDYPAQCEMNDVFAVSVVSKFLELLDRVKIVLKARSAEFRSVLRKSSPENWVVLVIRPERRPRQSDP